MALETEYRGYLIRYSENGDEWTCYDMGSGAAASAPTLSKMKAKIDKYLLGIRKEAAVECLELETYSGLRITDAVIIEYLGPKVEGGGWNRKPAHVSSHKVAAMAQRTGRERTSRRETDLRDFIPNTPAANEAIDLARRLGNAAKDAERAYKEAVAAIPRLTIDDIAELVRVSGLDPSGGLALEEGERQ